MKYLFCLACNLLSKIKTLQITPHETDKIWSRLYFESDEWNKQLFDTHFAFIYRWADQCPTYAIGHDKSRLVVGFSAVGQNIAWGNGPNSVDKGLSAMIQMWYDEVIQMRRKKKILLFTTFLITIEKLVFSKKVMLEKIFFML